MALVLFATALLVLFRSCPAGQEKVGAAARSAAPALPGWTLHHDENNVWGRARASADSDGIRFLGNFSSWDDCAAAVAAANATRGPFSSSTWYAPGFIHDMRSPFDGNCFAATDTAWKPHINQGVRSARGPSARVPPCADEMDCELNGLCSKITGQCVCHAGWVGETCGVLDLLPVKDPLATAPDGPRAYGTPPTQGGGGLASWGGSVVQDPGKPGLYHLFAAEMSLGCGLHAWFRNSLIRHATASSPRGPFAAQEVVLPAFSHEPVVVALPAGAGFLLYKIGCADNATVGSNSKFTGPCTGCANGTTAGLCPAPDQAYLSTCQDVLFASTLSGPWTRRNLSGFEPSSWDWLHLNSGLESHAPVIMPNGSVLTFTRSFHDPRPAPVSSVWLVSADSWNGTYKSLSTNNETVFDIDTEDSFMWLDPRGNFHALFHTWPSTAAISRGGHGFSRDGRNWSYSNQAYNTSVALEGGRGLYQYAQRERPHLLLDSAGDPAFLSNGVQPARHSKDWSFTAVFAVRRKIQM